MTQVVQMVDSLALGGLERVAVDLANGLAEASDQHPHGSLLCATRLSGPLEHSLSDRVELLLLNRTSRIDLDSARRCAAWLAERNTEVLHAHGSSLFFANLVNQVWPRRSCGGRPQLVWHDHFGRFATERRNPLLYRLLTARVSAIVSVNQQLREWAIQALRFPADRCHYVANSIDARGFRNAQRPPIQVRPLRIICVANLRRQKNHGLLFKAIRRLLDRTAGSAHCPDFEVQLVGLAPEPGVKEELTNLSKKLEIDSVVQFLGERSDVSELLQAADIGVLTSLSEGLPLALLEYGAAGLAVAATGVGQVPSVVHHQQTGLLLDHSIEGWAEALERLLTSPELRQRLGSQLQHHVAEHFSQEATLRQIAEVYRSILN